jgi:putative MATE family efflux protein
VSRERDEPSAPRAGIDPAAAPDLPSGSLAAGAAIASVEPVALDSRGEIWALAWPVMLSQVLLNVVGLVDIAMVGRLGSESVAAVGYASQFFHLSQSVLFAVGFSCVALMSQAIGAGNIPRARQALAASLLVSVCAAAVLTGIMVGGAGALLRLLGAQPDLVERGVPYMQLVVGSSFLLAISMTLEFALRADRDARTPMWIAGIVTTVKLAGNAVLIFGAGPFPRLELVGAGLATLLSQMFGLALFAVVLLRARDPSPLALRVSDLRGSSSQVREVVRLALPGIGERLANNFALLAYFRVLSGYGPLAIATYTVGIRLLAFTWIPGVGFGTAASTLVGQAVGAERPEAATRAGWRATRLALMTAAVLGFVTLGFPEPLARLFTSDAELIEGLIPFLIVLALAQPSLQGHFALGGALRGAGDTWTPFIAATLGNWAIRVPLALVAAYVFEAPVVWVWIVILADHTLRSAWLALAFQRGRWRGGVGGTARA